jgi:hypothetical protein
LDDIKNKKNKEHLKPVTAVPVEEVKKAPTQESLADRLSDFLIFRRINDADLIIKT